MNSKPVKELTIREKAWGLYFKMRFDRSDQKELQQPRQVGGRIND